MYASEAAVCSTIYRVQRAGRAPADNALEGSVVVIALLCGQLFVFQLIPTDSAGESGYIHALDVEILHVDDLQRPVGAVRCGGTLR